MASKCVQWLKRLFDRIPRYAYQIGLVEHPGCRPYYGYVVFGRKDHRQCLQSEIDEIQGDEQFMSRRVWISPARVERNGEFPGW